MKCYGGGKPETRISASKPTRKEAKPIPLRRFVEDCEYGDRVVFPNGAPTIASRADECYAAPSDRGEVTLFTRGHGFVRFTMPDGSTSEPLCVMLGQPIVRTGGYR